MQKKYTPFVIPRFSQTTKNYKHPYTSTTTTTSTTPAPSPTTSPTITKRPKYKRYTSRISTSTPAPRLQYNPEISESSEEVQLYETNPPQNHYPKSTTKSPYRRKRPLANSSSNRNEVKLKPTSSFVEFYAENQDSGESNEFALAGQKSPYQPNEYSFQFEHPEYSPTPSRPAHENVHLFSADIKTHKFGSQEGDFGFFKPIVTSPSPGHSITHHSHHHSRDKYSPVHTDFATDLHLAELPLESVPSSLKNFHHPPKSDPFDNSEFYPKKPFNTKHLSAPDHIFRPSTISHHHVSYVPASNVASREQIDLYNDDLREHYEAQLEKQLRNSKNPADRAKYHQFLKAIHDERLEQQQSKRQPPVPSFRNRQRPGGGFHKSPSFRKNKPPRPFTTPGLRHFRDSQRFADRSYEFPFV